MVKSGILEGTLKSMVTKFNKDGEGTFIDKRKYNHRKIYEALDPKLVEYIQERRNLYLPISLAMVQKKHLRF